jgi:hypothetical protein
VQQIVNLQDAGSTPAPAATFVVMNVNTIATKIVDAMLSEGWFSDRWAGVKSVAGIGSDEYGLGKNTEKGWKPRYGPSGTRFTHKNDKPRRRTEPSRDTGEKTWEIG